MTKIERFEDIEAWQKARELASGVYGICRSGPLRRDFGLRDQITRSAVSVMANIAEGFGRRTNNEEFTKLQTGYNEVTGKLIGFIRYLESHSGPR